MADGLSNPLAFDIYDRLDALGVAIPQPATVMPSSESTGGSAGSDTSHFAQLGHSHPRLTSTTPAVLAADGTATVMFTRTFAAQPGVVMTEVNASGNQPLVMVVRSFVMSNSVYAGAVIKGYRSNPLPSQNQLSIASLLTGVISSLNAIASSLTGFNVFGGTTTGAQVSVIAIARSDL